jgi:hypothetical protein
MLENDAVRSGTCLAVAALAAALLAAACDQAPADFPASIQREWATKAADGQAERVLVDDEAITWAYRTEKQFACPYRVMSFSEKARTIDISLLCRKRTGSELPVAHRLEVGEDGGSFVLRLEGRAVGLFEAEGS